MLITIEKVLILRSVKIFSTISDETLSQIAPFLNEINVASGEMIIKKGDFSSSLYIIVNGEVRVQDNNLCIATLKERDVFGELAALDPEQRVANVIASQDCLLLQLDHKTLNDIIAQHPEIAEGIIQFLCNRLRSTLQVLSEP